MSVQISTSEAIQKLLAFVRVGSKADFEVHTDLIQHLFKALSEFAEETGMYIDVVTPDLERVVAFGSGGILVGAAAGYLLGAIPGALLGMVAGGLAGVALSRVTVCIRLPAAGSATPATLQLI
jgi:hypothetical protein